MTNAADRGGARPDGTGVADATPEDDRAIEAWARDALTVDVGTSWESARERLGAAALAHGAVDIAYEHHETPLGRLMIGATEVGVVRVALPAEDEDAVLAGLAAKVSPRMLRTPRATITQARCELEEYFSGSRREFHVPLDWALTTGFRRAVLHATAEIPYGSTASYGDVAENAGSPRATRAAGTALATNPLPIIVPCHRVLRSGGEIGQYLGGVEMKRALLALERSA